MIAAAHQYKHVVRLKGGDPAIFGRVYEELEALKQQAIEVEIVPGITSASAAAATMNVGLTMRQVAPSVTFQQGISKMMSAMKQILEIYTMVVHLPFIWELSV